MTGRLERLNQVRRACGLVEISRDGRPWKQQKGELFFDRVRERDEIVANCAAYCRTSLGYTTVNHLDMVTNGRLALVLVRCGYMSNPDFAFALTYDVAEGRVIEDGMEESEFQLRKAELTR